MKKGGLSATASWVLHPTDWQRRKYGLVFIVCVCVFITHRSFTKGSHVNLLPLTFFGGVLTEKVVWLMCWWKWKWGSPSLQIQQLIYVGISVASGSLGEGKEKGPLLNPEKDYRGLVFGEKPSCLNTVKHLHIRTALIKSAFKIKPI